MPSQPPIPPLLSPYISHSTHSPQSLTLITSVLAATSNWLLLRYLYDVMSAHTKGGFDKVEEEENFTVHHSRVKKIVLVSFLRDWAFWKAEMKRLGLDLQRFVDTDKLRFVDGLTGLFESAVTGQPQQKARMPNSLARPGTAISGTSLGSGRPIPMRGRQGESVSVGAPTPATTTKTNEPKRLQVSTANGSTQGAMTVLDCLENDILSVINGLKHDPPLSNNDNNNTHNDNEDEGILLILDQPDFILASIPGTDADGISEWIMGLQQHVHSIIVTTAADFPLVHNAAVDKDTSSTPLERHHAAFVVGMAHRASLVLQLRTLDTGAAKDVSGVVRMGKGGGFTGGTEQGDSIVEKEALYFVQRDGGVKVFGRGEV